MRNNGSSYRVFHFIGTREHREQFPVLAGRKSKQSKIEFFAIIWWQHGKGGVGGLTVVHGRNTNTASADI
jgi:hypothetical protein